MDMSKTLIKNAAAIVTCDHDDRILTNADILIDGPQIVRVGVNISAPDAAVIDAAGRFVYPGLVNTHHHLLQAFSRNIPRIQNSELFDWLMYLYKVWTRVNPDYMYYASMVAMGEFVKFGGTTMFDQHFAFPRSTSKQIIDREFDAAHELGLRFHAGRSSFTRGQSNGGLPPDELVETCDETLQDCERLINMYHNGGAFSMRQVVVSPCSPFSVDSEVMTQSAKLARAKNVRLHTHLCETIDEENYCLEVYGKRPLDWAEACGWTGDDVWYAHGIHFTDDEVRRLAETQTGVAHCPVSNMKLASGVCKIPLMLELGVPVGLAVDGSGSNDASNLMADIRAAFLLHRLQYSRQAPSGYEFLKMATSGSAQVLGRSDIGSLEEGKAADLFMIDIDQLDFVGGTLDPAAFLATVGYGRPASLTMINGRVVFKDGKLLGINEEHIREEAKKHVSKVYENLPTT